MVQLQRSGSGPSLHRRAIAAIPAGTVQDGMILKPNQLIDALKGLKEQQRWHKAKVNLSLGPQAFYMRKVKLPQMTGAEVNRAMFWEVEKNFPLQANEAIFDYCLLNKTDDQAKEQHYLLAAADRNIADTYTAVAAEAGFRVLALEIQPLAHSRAICYSHNLVPKMAPQGASGNDCYRVLLDIGFSAGKIIITRGDEYLFSRNIKTGIGYFCSTLQKAGQTDFSSALGRVFAGSSLAHRGLLAAADQFALNVGQSLAYWADQSASPEPVLHSLEFCGGGAFIPGLAGHVEQKLSIKRRLYNPLSPLSGSKRKTQPDLYREEALYPAAFGLALRGWLQ